LGNLGILSGDNEADKLPVPHSINFAVNTSHGKSIACVAGKHVHDRGVFRIDLYEGKRLMKERTLGAYVEAQG
jgi:hypothetical protein